MTPECTTSQSASETRWKRAWRALRLWLPIAISIVMVTERWWGSERPSRLRVREHHAVDLMSPDSLLTALPLKLEWVGTDGIWDTPINLKRLHVTKLTFENEGGEPFAWAERATRPVRLSIAGQGEILAVFPKDIDSTVPAKFTHVQRSGSVEIEAEYLNPGEGFALWVYHNSSESPQLELSGRIFGQTHFEIERVAGTTSAPSQWWGAFLGLALGTVGIWVAELLMALRRSLARRLDEAAGSTPGGTA